MHETDHDYFRRRAKEERDAGERARHQHAKRAHFELAERYGEMAEATRPVQTAVTLPVRR